MQRRRFTMAAGLAALGSGAWAANEPIRLVVPFAAGGSTDLLARLLAKPLEYLLRTPVIVDNRAGAGGSLGMSEVASAAPDGLTVGLATVSTHGVNPAIYKSLPYDAQRDFRPVIGLVTTPNVMAVHPSTPGRDHAEFLRYAKLNPGRVGFASPGVGSLGHMLGELHNSTTNTKLVHIPFKGAAPAKADVIDGHTQVLFDNLPSSIADIQGARLRALAVSAPRRLPSLPQVPTFAELGLFINNDPSWFGLVVPAKTPIQRVAALHQAGAAALQRADVLAALKGLGMDPWSADPQEFQARMDKEIRKMTAVSRLAKISLAKA